MNGGKKPTLPEALGAYQAKNPARFHMPGHKGNTQILEKLVAWDFTEISPTDDLAHPQSCILASEDTISRVYGARHSFLCVNGSTSCILTMLLSLGQSKHVLLARDCHKSALAGAALAGHRVSFVYPEYDEASGLFGVVSAGGTEAALALAQSAGTPIDAVLITSPNYYGLVADIPKISAVCKAHRAKLFVDAAHAAHFPFINALKRLLPQNGEADMFCTSTHKTLAALTQTALLHVNQSCALTDAQIRKVMALTETSSPSYVLMSSIDWAIHDGLSGRYETHYNRILTLRERLCGAFNGIELLGEAPLPEKLAVRAIDSTRLTLNVTGRGISGKQAAMALMEQEIYPEMADFESLVLISSPDDRQEWYERLFRALDALPYGKAPLKHAPVGIRSHKTAVSVREATLGEAKAQALTAKLAGRICAGTVGIYPPGTAIIAPGEIIEKEDVEYLKGCLDAGLYVFGLEDGKVLVKA